MGKKSRNKHQRRVAPQPTNKVSTPQSTSLGEKLAQPQHMRVAAKDGFSDYSMIRSDIRKILMILLLSASILTAAVILNSRSSILRDAGRSVATFMEF